MATYNTTYNTKRRLSASWRLLLDERFYRGLRLVDEKFDFLGITRVVEEIACLHIFSSLQLIIV